jgi:hypothetical protein
MVQQRQLQPPTRIELRGASSLASALRKREEELGVTSDAIRASYLLARYIWWLELPWYKRLWLKIKQVAQNIPR